MGDTPDNKKNDRNTIVSFTLGNDDLARPILGTNPTWYDGGHSSRVSLDLQKTRSNGSAVLGGVGWDIYGPHIRPYSMRVPGGPVTTKWVVDLNERQPLGVFEAYAGKATLTSPATDTSWRNYGEVQVSYNDTTLTPKLQNDVHRLLHGRNVTKEYALSGSKEGLNAGLAGASEFQLKRTITSGIEARAAAFVAGEAGTDRFAGAVGGRVVIGNRIDGLPTPIPAANPEATSRTWVAVPSLGKAGAWSVGIEAEQYAIAKNRFLAGGEQQNDMPFRAAVTAALGISRNVTLGAGADMVSNPVAPSPYRLAPSKEYTASATIRVRF